MDDPNHELKNHDPSEQTNYNNEEQPLSFLPKSVLDFHPVVFEPLDLLIDSTAGVVLGRSRTFHQRYGLTGLGLIGAITESHEDILQSQIGMPVNLDLVRPHVIFVAGKRGSGKSYTLGMIAEELARAMEREEIEVAVIIIDPVDVFRQMIDPNNEQVETIRSWGLEPRGFPAVVYVPQKTFDSLPKDVREQARLRPLSISPSELSGADWGFILEKEGSLSTTMDNLINDVIESLRQGYMLEDGERVPPKSDFSIRNMIECIELHPRISELYKNPTRMALIQRLRRAQKLGIFNPGGVSAQDLAVAGQITIIDVAPLGANASSVLAILTNLLTRQILTFRMAWTEEGESAREELPPTWLIVDEAHTLVPKTGQNPAKDAIISYTKLGRRFGCSIVLCTQQPSAVADEAISQADVFISHTLVHDADIRALQQRAPAVMPNAFRDKVFISSLPTGVALVFDQTTENKRGFMVQIRPRISKHGGTDRLSTLFEASQLATPSMETTEPTEIEVEESSEPESPLERASDVLEIPRPPVKLSRSDWELLDGWIREYVKHLFERHKQELNITDEPSPFQRTAEPRDATIKQVVEVLPLKVEPVKIPQFRPISPSLFRSAILRKILYDPLPHEFLFSGNVKRRENLTTCSKTNDSQAVIEKIAGILSKFNLEYAKTVTKSNFPFLFFKGPDVRAVITAGKTPRRVCIGLVLVGSNVNTITKIAQAVERMILKRLPE